MDEDRSHSKVFTDMLSSADDRKLRLIYGGDKGWGVHFLLS